MNAFTEILVERRIYVEKLLARGAKGDKGERGVGYISVKDDMFAGGAVGDGTNDDTDAMIAAIDYSSENKIPILFPAGRYRASAEITQADHIGGWELVGQGRPRILHDFASPAGPALFGSNGSGSIGSPILVTSSIAAGDFEIELASTTGLSTGDTIVLRDLATNLYDDSGGTSSVDGEIARISRIVDANNIEVWGALENAYALVNSGPWSNNNIDVRKLNLAEDISIRGIDFEDISSSRSTPNPDPPDTSAEVLNMGQLGRLRIADCNFFSFFAAAIRTEFGLDTLIDACSAIDFDVFGGYFWVARKGSGGMMRNCVAHNIRHLYTTTGNATEIPPQHVLIESNKISGQTSAAALDTHSAGKYTDFLFNEDSSHRVNANAGDSSIQIRSYYCRVIGNRITGGGHDIGINLLASAQYCEVAYNDIRGVKSGVVVSEAQGAKIHHNRIFCHEGGVTGIVVSRSGVFPIPMVDLEISNNEINGDPDNPLTYGISFGVGGFDPTFILKNNITRNCDFDTVNSQHQVVAVTDTGSGGYSLISQDSGREFDNTGAAAETEFNLPKCRVGNRGFKAAFRNASLNGTKIGCEPGDRIHLNSNAKTLDGSYIETFDIDAWIELEMVDATSWQARAMRGDWIAE